ncbi:hypothetical protein ABPG72_008408 [Tetrahymena utriculariae]
MTQGDFVINFQLIFRLISLKIVFYFGKERIRPNVFSDHTPIIKKISFLGKDIINFDSKEEKKMFVDYIEMIKFVQEKDLCFKQVVCSQNTAYILDAKDELWVFGEGGDGQLGISKLKSVLRQPINMSRFQNRYFTSVSCYSTHVLAISSTYKLYTWGNTEFGCQGNIMQNKYIVEPEKVKKNKFEEYIPLQEYSQLKVTHVATGPNFSLVGVNKGHLFSFGKEDKSRLGLGQFNIDYTEKIYKVDLPFSNLTIRGIACGTNHCLLWDTEGQIFSWGDGSHGKLGHSSVKGGYNYMIVNPQKIKALEDQKIIQASCGYNHSCALNFKGEIYTWGKTIYSKENKESQKIDYLRPKKLSCYIKSEQNIQIGTHAIKISTYGNQNAVVDDKGYVYTWGQNIDNCLGHEDSKDYNYPVCIEELTGTKCIDVGCGENFTVVIASEKINKQSYYNIKEFYSGILENAKEKVTKIKDFYQKKITKTMSNNSVLDRNTLQALNRMGSIVGSPSAFTRGDSPVFKPTEKQIQQNYIANFPISQKSQQKQFNIPNSEQQMNQKVSTNTINKVNSEKRQASFDSFSINRKIRQANIEIKKTKGEFNGYKHAVSLSQNKFRPLTKENTDISIQELQKEIVLDDVTQNLQFDDDEFIFHEEAKKQEERKNVKNDPRQFIKSKPKGVLVSSIFKEQIELIYKEYSTTEKKENLQEKYLKNVRSKQDDFFKARMKTDQSIRQKFKDAKKDLSISSVFVADNQSTENQMQETFSNSNSAHQSKYQLNYNFNRHSRPQTTSSQILQTTISQRSIQHNKLFNPSEKEQFLELPKGDFLKKQKFLLNQRLIDQKKEKLTSIAVLRDFRTELAKKKKQDIEQEKQKLRDQKRIEIFIKSKEYQQRLLQDQQLQQNTDSIRNNWAVYLNVEMICAGFQKLAELGLENLRKEFQLKVKLRKMQFYMRDFLMRKKIKKLTTKQIIIMRKMISCWVKRKQLQKLQQATKLVVLHCIQEKIKKKLRVNISVKRNQIIYIQNFMRWARKSLHQQRKVLSQIWDTHILHIFRQQIISRNLDGKQLDFYRNKFSNMLTSYTAIKQPNQHQNSTQEKPFLNSLIQTQINIELNTSQSQKNSQYQYSQNLQTLNIQDFQTVNGQIEDFETYLKGRSSQKSAKQNMIQMNNVQNVGFTIKDQLDDESIHEIIKRKAQQNTLFGGLLEQLKFKTNVRDSQVINYEEEELLNLDTKTDSKARNVIFKDQYQVSQDEEIKLNKTTKLETKSNLSKQNDQSLKSASQINELSDSKSDSSEDQIDQDEQEFNKKVPKSKQIQRRKQVFKRDEFSFADTLLPFSTHYFDLLLPSNYSIRIDSLKNQNQQALSVAKMAEITVKKKIIESILILTRSKYEQQIKSYNQKRKDFIEANKHLINLERAKIMLLTPAETLRGIHKREDVQYALKKKQYYTQQQLFDHLPFEELKQIIADRLPNAPKRPAYKVTINQELFRASFHKYVESVRKLMQEIEVRGIFKGKKKRDVSIMKKNNDTENEEDQDAQQINMEKLHMIFRNFERNFKI